MDGPGGERRLTFTGDLGRPGLPILRDPAPVPPADLLISESTYGGHTHEPVEETAERLGEVVRRTAERGGKLLIPAFSVGRTQTVVYFLHQLMNAGRLPDLPIYVDSPMAVRATEVFRAHPECFDEETLRLLAEHPDLFGEQRIHYVEKVHESIALNDRPEPCVIISASGMCEAGRDPAPSQAQHRGRSQHHPDRRLPGARHAGPAAGRAAAPRCASWAGRSSSGPRWWSSTACPATPTMSTYCEAWDRWKTRPGGSGWSMASRPARLRWPLVCGRRASRTWPFRSDGDTATI